MMMTIFPQCIACGVAVIIISIGMVVAYYANKDLKTKQHYYE
jgi:hypothetical protein